MASSMFSQVAFLERCVSPSGLSRGVCAQVAFLERYVCPSGLSREVRMCVLVMVSGYMSIYIP